MLKDIVENICVSAFHDRELTTATFGSQKHLRPLEQRSLKGVSKMEVMNWLDQTVKQTKDKYEARRHQEDQLVKEETLKCKLGGEFCRDLFEWLQTIDAQFNDRFGGHVLAASVDGTQGQRKARILARPIRSQERIAALSYQEDINCLALSVHSGTATDTQQIRMVLSPEGKIFAEVEADSYTPVQLGQKIIGDLLA